MKLVLPFLFLLLYNISWAVDSIQKIDADNPFIVYTGRFDKTNPKSVKYAWPGTSISASFEGRVCNIRLQDLAEGKDENGNPYHNYFNIIIDGKAPFVLQAEGSKKIYNIDSLQPGKHIITIFKRTETFVGAVIFSGFEIEKGKMLLPLAINNSLKLEFIGNSITCGYGNEGSDKNCPFTAETENNYMAYGAITARNLDAPYMAIAFSGRGLYQNFDKTRDNTLPDMYERVIASDHKLKWNFKSWVPDIVVINLGTNDFAHANPDSTTWVNKYLEFLKRVRSNYPEAMIICCEGPMMSDYWPEGYKALTTITEYLNAVVNTSRKNGDINIHVFFFPTQTKNYGCDWHPGVETHKKMATDLTDFINSIKKK
jgi:lysophospholipase L1-like esterase